MIFLCLPLEFGGNCKENMKKRPQSASYYLKTEYFERWVNIGSGNDLVLSINKPLPDQMLTQIYVAIWRD